MERYICSRCGKPMDKREDKRIRPKGIHICKECQEKEYRETVEFLKEHQPK